jgi:hypothetical protein
VSCKKPQRQHHGADSQPRRCKSHIEPLIMGNSRNDSQGMCKCQIFAIILYRCPSGERPNLRGISSAVPAASLLNRWRNFRRIGRRCTTGVIHTSEDWLTEFFYGTSAEAKARRDKAMPLINDDPTRIPDHIFSGPELPIDEGVKAHFFGEA